MIRQFLLERKSMVTDIKNIEGEDGLLPVGITPAELSPVEPFSLEEITAHLQLHDGRINAIENFIAAVRSAFPNLKA